MFISPWPSGPFPHKQSHFSKFPWTFSLHHEKKLQKPAFAALGLFAEDIRPPRTINHIF
jgi:hypothetical protein